MSRILYIAGERESARGFASPARSHNSIAVKIVKVVRGRHVLRDSVLAYIYMALCCLGKCAHKKNNLLSMGVEHYASYACKFLGIYPVHVLHVSTILIFFSSLFHACQIYTLRNAGITAYSVPIRYVPITSWASKPIARYDDVSGLSTILEVNYRGGGLTISSVRSN